MPTRPVSERQKKARHARLPAEVWKEPVIAGHDLAVSSWSEWNPHLPVDHVLVTKVRKLPGSERQQLTSETEYFSFHRTPLLSHSPLSEHDAGINSPKLRKQP